MPDRTTARSGVAALDGSEYEKRTTSLASLIIPLIAALALMTLAANCFLKYVWWTANYSAWQGIPKYAERWKAAGEHASFNGWSFILLDLASVAFLYVALRRRSTSPSGLLGNGMRLAASLVITIFGTAILAWLLSVIKQGTP